MKVFTTKISLFRFFVMIPLYRTKRWLGRFFKRLFDRFVDKVTDRWYCDGCRQYHGGWVAAYYLCDISDGVCYKHVRPGDVGYFERIRLAGKDVTQAVTEKLLADRQEPAAPVVPPYSAEEARAAGQIIKAYCVAMSEGAACSGCALRDMCDGPPFTWSETAGGAHV